MEGDAGRPAETSYVGRRAFTAGEQYEEETSAEIWKRSIAADELTAALSLRRK